MSFGRKSTLSFFILALGGLLASCGGGGGGSDGGGLNGDSAGVQGTIDIVSGSRVDRDYADLWRVNDGNWPDGSDGTVTLPVPATVGGYLSHRSGSDGSGRVYPEDNTDTYVALMEDGDRYVLQCFSSLGLDEDGLGVTLALDGTADNSDACGSGGIYEGGSGDVRITVSTNSDGGPLRYVLTIVPQGSLSTFNVSWPEPDLRVDEAIVTGPVAFASTLSSSGLRASSVMDVGRSIGPDTWHVRRDEGVNALSTRSTGTNDPRAETIEWIRTMREEFGLDAEPNYLVRQSTATPGTNQFYGTDNDNGDPDNWNLVQIKAPGAWGSVGAPDGQGVGVAIMDTGMFSTDLSTYGDWHEDLVNNVVDPAGGILDFVSDNYDVDGNYVSGTQGRDGNPATPPTPGDPGGTSFHGTHVAGIIAAEDNMIGTVGIAHQATILPYRVLGVDPVTGDDGTGAVADLIDAINTASDRTDVDVINLSLGGLPQLAPLQAATDRAYDNGILVVAAGGNSGDASAVYPAANRRVVGVGATNRDDELASYSNYGQSVDLLAPGGALDDGILNAYGNAEGGNLVREYGYLAGTSMAVPHLTGVYALAKSVKSDLSPDQFRAQLIAGDLTADPAVSGLDDYALFGAGLLDAQRALDNRGNFPTVVSAWPRVLEVSSSGNESIVLLEILKDDVQSSPTVSGAPVIPAPFEMTDGDGQPVNGGDPIPEALRIRVDPDALPANREASGNIEIEHTAENGSTHTLIVPVYVQSTDEPEDRSAGRHYVLLLDADDFDSSRSMQVVAQEGSGEYEYSLSDVTPGDYILVAGTDLDSNGFICENGEACAEYPNAGSREVISIGEGETLRLDMTTSFRRPTIAEMGLPRYGFEGYPVPDRSAVDTSVDRRLE
ncbi:S8 family serine peptidase [Marinobacter sp. OP 3.4]|uniref:S8 family serine peptidase n=1 Tax=Marinobacter sp. OP 3.4 TaxID=3076501 RepID=UPI002E1AE521